MTSNTELGSFLRARRASLDPDTAGVVPAGGTRRVPGLRRAEVAQLAGVSTDYLVRLEQGRHPRVSPEVLDALSDALRLDDVERQHLHDLAQTATGPRARAAAAGAPRTRSAMHQVIDVLGDVSPALVVNHRRDVLASNALARALLTDFDTLPAKDRNLARFVLLDPAARELFRDWEQVAQVYVANLRLAAGSHPDDRRLNELIGELTVRVPQFCTWWDSHRVRQCAHGDQRLRHPVAGDLTLHHESLALPADPGQEMCLYTAEPGTAHADALRLLASWTAPTAPKDVPSDARQR
ncbi:helix-turn-helix transcriptional regulator [Cellulomonas sp. Y8]|uniref:helix-turn-helix transcriptional regulator n=1 Tax=Cellulomonas sp. Y8 TaxID=2591145 RepID=UPI003D75E579